MIPDRPIKSSLSLAEWRAAFRVRRCSHCGAKIVPSERTSNPATARRIATCSKACESARWRDKRTPEQQARDAKTAASRFAKWRSTGDNYATHIKRAAQRKKRIGTD